HADTEAIEIVSADRQSAGHQRLAIHRDIELRHVGEPEDAFRIWMPVPHLLENGPGEDVGAPGRGAAASVCKARTDRGVTLLRFPPKHHQLLGILHWQEL